MRFCSFPSKRIFCWQNPKTAAINTKACHVTWHRTNSVYLPSSKPSLYNRFEFYTCSLFLHLHLVVSQEILYVSCFWIWSLGCHNHNFHMWPLSVISGRWNSSFCRVAKFVSWMTEEMGFDSWQGYKIFLFTKASRLTGTYPVFCSVGIESEAAC